MSEQEKNTIPEEERNPFDLPVDGEETVPVEEGIVEDAPAEDYKEKYEHEHDAHLRLAAEYDNFRKRSLKEKDASFTNGKASTLEKLLPVYDNLERAVNQPTEDTAFKKGVEMTMAQLVKIFTDLGVEIYGEVGQEFDPNLHNAVMHTEDESLGENTISQVFQKGFKIGDKVVRFAMVQVAN